MSTLKRETKFEVMKRRRLARERLNKERERKRKAQEKQYRGNASKRYKKPLKGSFGSIYYGGSVNPR